MATIKVGVPGVSIATLTSNTVRSNTILLRTNPYTPRREMFADATLKPGHLVKENSSGNAVVQTLRGGKMQISIVLEDAGRGQTIYGSTYGKANGEAWYAAGDATQVADLLPGDAFQGRLAAGALAITQGDLLCSAGDGTFCKAPATTLLVSSMTGVSANLSANTVGNFAGAGSNYTIAAGTLQAGDVIRVTAAGNTPTTFGTDTFAANLTINGVTVLTTGANDQADNGVFRVQADIVITSVGNTGTMQATGSTSIGVAGTATDKIGVLTSTTINTNADQTLRVSGVWSTNTTNIAVLRTFNIEVLRANNQGALVTAEESVDNSAGTDDHFINLRVLN